MQQTQEAGMSLKELEVASGADEKLMAVIIFLRLEIQWTKMSSSPWSWDVIFGNFNEF